LIGHLLRATLAVALVLFVALPPASSRTWKTTPDQIAQDYLTINDTRPGGEVVLLIWFASPMIRPGLSGGPGLALVLDKYVAITAVHGHLDKASGTVSFDDFNLLQANDQDGKSLTMVPRDKLPPTVAGVVTVLEGLYHQAAGAMGQGMKMFIFEAGSIGVCKPGRLSVPFAGETYTWNTPIPGCRDPGGAPLSQRPDKINATPEIISKTMIMR
jgi:hypothetical protein